MSRIGKKPVNLPKGVTVTIDEENKAVVKGPKGELQFTFNKDMKFEILEDEVVITRPSESKKDRTMHGTTRAILNNLVTGVNEGFEKRLEIIGVGYRAQLRGKQLTLQLGKSHPEEVVIPEGLEVEVPKNTQIIIKGTDKQLVGEFAANIRSLRSPEPYKGKGIRYVGERVRRKEGKTAK
ncbi:50S ribosomal protein L6 [Haloplasma contractile]|uniref:Large ribosomal subunit protein uL6 n=1 Tax=Haloplasma contractile SSD-17B TaxID=1033810 RepID=U2EB97_9MOLU|nr:50S ribosomal protein L6 [Haloplasma contractile]ERJ12373.1 50S ribosomal protein L6 [Haloplasma contractile SSD-17B]